MLPRMVISDYCQFKFEVKGVYDKPNNIIFIFEQSCFDDGLNYKWVRIHELSYYLIQHIKPLNKYIIQRILNNVSYEDMIINNTEEKLCNKLLIYFIKDI